MWHVGHEHPCENFGGGDKGEAIVMLVYPDVFDKFYVFL